ncbi:GAF domain-containing sensor histidine kinase [Pantanalinema sp. GBBB05]|uniref:GAF domain-containing sensor histidine kinase n=1 Tax=Pantanalinema sp. GBBB05 TaxID=2604139 RepID=UPI001DE8D856|nr:GAF domain-containing protein [Pantanalinema sp. GBBB05]
MDLNHLGMSVNPFARQCALQPAPRLPEDSHSLTEPGIVARPSFFASQPPSSGYQTLGWLQQALCQGGVLGWMMISQMSDGLLLVKVDDRQVIACNPALQHWLGYSETELLALTWDQLLVQNPTSLTPSQILRSIPDQPETGEQLYRCRDGSIVKLAINTCVLTLHNQAVLCIVAREPTCDLTTVSLISHAERERILNTIAQQIRYAVDLEPIFTIAATELSRLLNLEGIELWQYHLERQRWQIVTDYFPNPTHPSHCGTEIPDHPYCLSEQLQQLKVIHIPAHELPGAGDGQSELTEIAPAPRFMVPLYLQRSLWGGLSLLTHASSHSCDAEIDLILAVAEQLMIAIQQVQLYERLHQLNANLGQQVQQQTAQLRQVLTCEATLKRIIDKVRDSLDEQQILQTAVEELATVLVVNCCDTGLYAPNHTTVTIHYEYTNATHLASGKVIQLADATEIYHVLLSGQSVQFCLLNQSSPVERSHQAILACPILDQQGVMGDLWLFRQGQECYDELEVHLVQQVANQCGIAIRQARLYHAAQTQVESLEHLNQLKDDFLSTISHELRTPISNIKMATQMLTIALSREGLLSTEPSPLRDSPKIAHYLKILQDESNREINLITDLLDLQRLEAGTQTLSMQPIQCSPYLVRIAQSFQERIQEQGQHLQVNIPPNLPYLLSNAQSLERVLVELLTNACKYTPADEFITVSAQVAIPRDANPASPTDRYTSYRLSSTGRTQQDNTISTRQPTTDRAEILQITISNSGIEIPTNQLNHIFDKFYRVPNSDPHKYGGTGLGLALVKKLVSCLGGKIWADSANSQTYFTLELPIQATPHP